MPSSVPPDDDVIPDDGDDEPLSTAATCPKCNATPAEGWSPHDGECDVCGYYVGDDDDD